MADIPMEIIIDEILPKLPAKSLIRFKCVSKTWLSIISTQKFINNHLHYSQFSNTNHLLLFTGNDHSLSLHNLDMPETPNFKLTSFGIEPVVVGSCNGLVFIQSYGPYSLLLLNPSTGSHRRIPSLLPPRKCLAMNFGFGCDRVNDDYKVVRIADRTQVDRIVHVYSLNENSWEIVEWTFREGSMGFRENGVFLEDRLHFKFWGSIEGRYRVRSFSLKEKNWTHDISLPNYMETGLGSGSGSSSDDVRDGLKDLGVFEGCLCVLTTNLLHSDVDIWVMKEYGVKESWVRMFKISDLDPRVLGSLRVSAVVFQRLKGRILLRTVSKTEHKIWWYSMKDKTVNCVENDGFEDCAWIDVCKGSLVEVPGGSQMGKIEQKVEI